MPKTSSIRLSVSIEHRLLTDRQTDGQTDTGPWLVPRMHSIAPVKTARLCRVWRGGVRQL